MSKPFTIRFNTRSVDDYETFLKVRRCPVYHFSGNAAVIPQEYASQIGVKTRKAKTTEYEPVGSLFDYQRDITQLAIKKRKFAVFADCGQGLTLMGRHQHTLAHVDRRAKNNQRIADVCEIRDDAMRLGLQTTTERWQPRYAADWIEDVVFYRLHKSLIEGSCQHEVDCD